MQILLIKIAVIIIFWSEGMFALNKVFGMTLKRREQIHIRFLRSMFKVVLTIIAFICISGPFNTTKTLSTTLLASSSLLVVIMGFAAQQILADVINGIVLSWSHPSDLGERVSISSLGISGVVEDMTMRHTVIRAYHNSRVIIPNNVTSKAIVENGNYNNDYIGSYMEVSISYESSLEQVIEVMRETIASYPLVVDIRPNPSEGNKVNIAIKEPGDDGIVLKSTVWTRNIDDNFTACSDTRRLIKKNFDAADIFIPYRHIHVIIGNSNKKSENNGIIQK